jgi:hypothetical protein
MNKYWEPIVDQRLRVSRALAPNVQITNSADGLAAECSVAINPAKPSNLICALRQLSPGGDFASLSTTVYYSTDTGATWTASQPLRLEGKDLASADVKFGANANPSIACDAQGNAYLLTLAITVDLKSILGIAFYKSIDGGANWSNPFLIHSDPEDDKPTVLVDTTVGGAFDGRIYAFWMTGGFQINLELSRSNDQGKTWSSPNTTFGLELHSLVWPSVSLSPDGELYASYLTENAATAYSAEVYAAQVVRSLDGGDNFKPCAEIGNIQILQDGGGSVTVGDVHESGSEIALSSFRANSIVSVCAGNGGLVLCAWLESTSDLSARLVYCRSMNYGTSWTGTADAVLGKGVTRSHPFYLSHGAGVDDAVIISPQFAVTPSGVIVCNYYAYWPIDISLNVFPMSTGLLGTYASVSFDRGESFRDAHKISELSWSTKEAKMIVLGQIDGTDLFLNFVGDYFGLAVGKIGQAGEEGFVSTWTDGTSGAEEIFSSTVVPVPQ